MQLNPNHTMLLLCAGALVLSGCGTMDGVDDGPGREQAPLELPRERVSGAEASAEGSAERYNSEDQAQYDEVGYAVSYETGQTSLGESFNPSAISAAHATINIPAFAEITHLMTGRTILVRINDRGSASARTIMSLSPGAMQQLGVDQDERVPVRVRRVNPPEQEKAALKMGQKAGDRLDTPEPLLVALRRKLGTMPSTNPVQAAAPKPKPAPIATKPAARPGAQYDPAPRPTTRSDRFIIEDGTKPVPNRAPQAAAPTGGYYIQIAAFSDLSRAQSLAKQLGARVEQAGSVWRVRKGPYGDEAAARAALGPIVAKGYRSARITR